MLTKPTCLEVCHLWVLCFVQTAFCCRLTCQRNTPPSTVAIICIVGQISCSNSFAILPRNSQMPNSAIDLSRSRSRKRTRDKISLVKLYRLCNKSFVQHDILLFFVSNAQRLVLSSVSSFSGRKIWCISQFKLEGSYCLRHNRKHDLGICSYNKYFPSIVTYCEQSTVPCELV